MRNLALQINKKILAWALLILLSCIWGSSYILIKKALCFLEPQEIVFLRILLAAIALLPYSIPHLFILTYKQYFVLSIMGIMGTLLPLCCFSIAQLHINSGVHGVLNSLTPVFVLLVGIVFFKKKIFRNEILGVFLGIGGTILLMITESKTFAGNFNYYILLSLFGSFLYGNTTNVIKYYLYDMKSTTIVSVSLFLTGLIAVIYFLFHPETFTKINPVVGSHKALIYVLIAGVLNLGIANIILTTLVKITSPVFTSIEALVAPVISLSWGLIDGEKLFFGHYLGAIIILLGVYCINRSMKLKSP